VLLAYIHHVSVIPLTNLRVIRGHALFEDNGKEYSLYVSGNYVPATRDAGLKELQLTSLHGEILYHYFILNLRLLQK